MAESSIPEQNDTSKWIEKYANDLALGEVLDSEGSSQPRAILSRRGSLIRRSSSHSDTAANASSMNDSLLANNDSFSDELYRSRRSESMIDQSFHDSDHHDSFNVGSPPMSRNGDGGYFTESPLSVENRTSPRKGTFSSGGKAEMECPKMRMTEDVRFSARQDRSNSSGSNQSFSDHKGSPTIEQAIMMGCPSYDGRERTVSAASSRDSAHQFPPSEECDMLSEEAQLIQILQSLQVDASSNAPIPPLTVMGPMVGVPVHYPLQNNSALERAALQHRNAASINEAKCTWSGVLPTTTPKNATYSPKVFLGGVPWDITEHTLIQAFRPYGSVLVEWPGNNGLNGLLGGAAIQPRGCVYVLFEHEKQVKALLTACTHDFSNGNWYFKISSRRMRSKQVQVIPWIISDSNYVCSPARRLEPQKTVFVGALHGMMTASALATVFQDLFGGVMYAGIDTDKYKYPIGSGRVTFSNHKSYMKAVAAAFVEIKTAKFSKKVQIDPYLEESICSSCGAPTAPYFCRDLTCFKYFCQSCWSWQHSMESLKHHRPLMRHTRPTRF